MEFCTKYSINPNNYEKGHIFGLKSRHSVNVPNYFSLFVMLSGA